MLIWNIIHAGFWINLYHEIIIIYWVLMRLWFLFYMIPEMASTVVWWLSLLPHSNKVLSSSGQMVDLNSVPWDLEFGNPPRVCLGSFKLPPTVQRLEVSGVRWNGDSKVCLDFPSTKFLCCVLICDFAVLYFRSLLWRFDFFCVLG